MHKIFVSALFFLSALVLSQAQVKSDSLILYYPFSGNTQDASGNGIDATNNGATLTNDRWLSADSAYSFDGINDYLVIPDTSLLNVNFPFSVSFWVKLGGYTSNHQGLITNYEPNNLHSGFYIKTFANGELIAAYGDGNGNSSGNRRTKESNFQLQLNRWYHIAVSYNALNNIDIYINGILYPGTYTGSATSFANTPGNGSIGRNFTGSGNTLPLDGAMDDIRIYSDALTQREVRQLYYNSECQNLVTVYDTLTINDTMLVSVFDTVTVNDTVFTTLYDSIAVTDTLIINVPLSVPSPIINTIKVFPNPAKDELHITMGQYYQLLKINIVDASGQAVYNQVFSSPLITIDLTKNLTAKGIYFINILDVTNQVIDTRKILIQ
jgi:hypothetical protein